MFFIEKNPKHNNKKTNYTKVESKTEKKMFERQGQGQ